MWAPRNAYLVLADSVITTCMASYHGNHTFVRSNAWWYVCYLTVWGVKSVLTHGTSWLESSDYVETHVISYDLATPISTSILLRMVAGIQFHWCWCYTWMPNILSTCRYWYWRTKSLTLLSLNTSSTFLSTFTSLSSAWPQCFIFRVIALLDLTQL